MVYGAKLGFELCLVRMFPDKLNTWEATDDFLKVITGNELSFVKKDGKLKPKNRIGFYSLLRKYHELIVKQYINVEDAKGEAIIENTISNYLEELVEKPVENIMKIKIFLPLIKKYIGLNSQKELMENLDEQNLSKFDNRMGVIEDIVDELAYSLVGKIQGE